MPNKLIVNGAAFYRWLEVGMQHLAVAKTNKRCSILTFSARSCEPGTEVSCETITNNEGKRGTRHARDQRIPERKFWSAFTAPRHKLARLRNSRGNDRFSGNVAQPRIWEIPPFFARKIRIGMEMRFLPGSWLKFDCATIAHRGRWVSADRTGILSITRNRIWSWLWLGNLTLKWKLHSWLSRSRDLGERYAVNKKFVIAAKKGVKLKK